MQTEASPLTHIQNASAHFRGLLASEWRLARREVAANLRAARTGLILTVFGVAAALSALSALTAAVFFGLAAAGLEAWLAALATGAVMALLAALLIWVGVSRLSPKALAPTESASHAAETLRLVTEKTHVS